jgi:hypothetical protein
MTTLNWRTAREAHLTEALIPNPNSTSQLMQNLTDVRVAFDGGLVHIDPRHPGAQDLDPGNPEFTVTVVSASSVHAIQYVEPKEEEVPEVEESLNDAFTH